MMACYNSHSPYERVYGLSVGAAWESLNGLVESKDEIKFDKMTRQMWRPE